MDSRKVICLEETDSTNNYAKTIASEGAAHGTTVIAKCQTAGKGRMGRSFISPKGTGLYMTVIIRENISTETLPLLTPLAAVAVSRTVDRLSRCNSKIKWVNDIYLNGKKICGILTEGSLTAQGSVNYAVVGIGINLLAISDKLPDELLDKVTSIEEETGVRCNADEMSRGILACMDELLPQIGKGDFISEYRSKSCVIGCDVLVTKFSPPKFGTAIDIDDRGRLVVEYMDGSREALDSGEANVIRGGQEAEQR